MITRKAILWLISGVAGCFAFLFLFYYLLITIGGEKLEEQIYLLWYEFRDILVNHGLILFLSIAILPGFILPVAPLLTLAGLWAEQHGPWEACFFCLLALIINLTWTYWLARGPARSLIQGLLGKTKFNLPPTPPANLVHWALILRLTPGVPFIFSNYGLGILQMPFLKYLILSVPIIGVTACGYVLAFAGIFSGDWQYLWIGSCLIGIMLVLGRMTLKKNRNAN
ncbi:MAG: hypothetical protein P8N49_03000 [Opitutales bacterium]|nr:hypothetical protein [Opitutales bacterium]